MHEELIDIYDESMKKVGQIMKKEAHRQGLWHKSIHCWLFQKSKVDGKVYVIVQKRASAKLLMPDYFDVSVAGHYELNEDKTDGLREVQEEFGLKVPLDSWHYLGIKYDVGRSPNVINKEFCEVYFAEIENELSEFILCPQEVDSVVKIEISKGQALFSGECESIEAEGFRWDFEKNRLEPRTFTIKAGQFIPRLDSYYAKIFAIADLYFKGYKYLYI